MVLKEAYEAAYGAMMSLYNYLDDLDKNAGR